jgi:hypothetical protein
MVNAEMFLDTKRCGAKWSALERFTSENRHLHTPILARPTKFRLGLRMLNNMEQDL